MCSLVLLARSFKCKLLMKQSQASLNLAISIKGFSARFLHFLTNDFQSFQTFQITLFFWFSLSPFVKFVIVAKKERYIHHIIFQDFSTIFSHLWLWNKNFSKIVIQSNSPASNSDQSVNTFNRLKQLFWTYINIQNFEIFKSLTLSIPVFIWTKI